MFSVINFLGTYSVPILSTMISIMALGFLADHVLTQWDIEEAELRWLEESETRQIADEL